MQSHADINEGIPLAISRSKIPALDGQLDPPQTKAKGHTVELFQRIEASTNCCLIFSPCRKFS